MHYFVLSGMMRSGTTLLQRAIDAHPQASCSYQDATALFIDCKKAFLRSINNRDYHVLSHYSGPGHYPAEQFDQWMNENGDAFLATLKQHLQSAPGATCCGVKEVLVEEFFPFLTRRNLSCLLIIRDPRDVIASMSFGRGMQHTGKPRPVLFDIRNWRKSIRIAQALESERHFMAVRFEDLLNNRETVMNQIYSWLSLPLLPMATIETNMRNTGDEEWKGNSSFAERDLFDNSAIGVYRNRLPDGVREYIEATCASELRWLGYDVEEKTTAEKQAIIKSYKDPFVIDRPEFAGNYSSTPENIDYETTRISERG